MNRHFRGSQSLRLMLGVLLVATLAVPVAGCASGRAKKALKQLQGVLNPLLGKTDAEVVLALGAPQSREEIGGFTVWHYFNSYGTRSAAGVAPNPYYTTGSGRSWDVYDKFDLFFKDGHLTNFRVLVQR